MLKIVNRLIRKYRLLNYRSKGIIIGKNTFISSNAYIDKHSGSNISIGNNCYITRNVVILNHTDTHRGGPLGIWEQFGSKRISLDVKIGNNVFIGVNSVIMPGVTIGDNSIIGALTLVNDDIPPGEVYAGIPAKRICRTSELITKSFPNFNLEGWQKLQ